MVSRARRSADDRFEIRWDYMSGGITYDEEFDEDWTLVDVASGQKLTMFQGNGRKDFPSTYQGVKSVEFSKNGFVVIARHYDGKVERVVLPGTSRMSTWCRRLWRWSR